ncbi:hypothetical protein GF327_10450, partial [Candidatus Woesearchaeota archaeon]|nr:hypothetical protein [Candidatus Woesearchaeota archaeon]
IKNMITGASQAEAAVLIVDASQGVEEQTKRHSYLIEMLGLKQVVVVINKMDKVDYSKERFEKVKKDLIDFFKKLAIEPGFVIPISALRGDNIAKLSENTDWYKKKTVLDALDDFRESSSSNELPLRLPVQDVYDIDGRKIFVGRVEAGIVRVGDEVNISPLGEKVKVRTIEEWKKSLDKAETGESIGFTFDEDIDIDRGEIISSGRLPDVSDEFFASIYWMTGKPFLKDLAIKCATQEIPCEIIEIKERIDSSSFEVLENNAKILKETDIGKVMIKTRKPLVKDNFYDIEALGRFVLTDKGEVLGAGIVTN